MSSRCHPEGVGWGWEVTSARMVCVEGASVGEGSVRGAKRKMARMIPVSVV